MKAYKLVLLFLFLPLTAFADTSLGGIAENVLGPVGGLTQLVYIACYAIGGAMLMGAVLQYKAHRDNPSQIRLSSPVILLILGLILVGIPLVTKYSPSSSIASFDTTPTNTLKILNPTATPSSTSSPAKTQNVTPTYRTAPSRPNPYQTQPQQEAPARPNYNTGGQ